MIPFIVIGQVNVRVNKMPRQNPGISFISTQTIIPAERRHVKCEILILIIASDAFQHFA